MASESVTQSALKASQRMRIAYLLTFVGGYLDAYTYFKRGGVFSSAQTGNVVKLGIALANGEGNGYLHYLLPITAFALGVLSALMLKEHLALRRKRLVRRSVLVLEMCCLTVVGLIPVGDQWNTLANCIVSFVTAMQFETFTTFRGDVVVTIAITGDLRKFVHSLFVGVMHVDMNELARAWRFINVLAMFTAGAFLGTLICKSTERAEIAPAVVVPGIATLIITVLRRRQAQ